MGRGPEAGAEDGGVATVQVPARRAAVRRFTVRVIDGPSRGVEHASTGERLVVGTHASAGLVLDDPTMSRFHCEIAIEDERALVRDLGSLNGTVVDGVTVLGAVLADGAVLTLGETKLRFSLGDGEIELPQHPSERFGLLVGRSRAMRTVMALLARAAQADTTVLLSGETGTGKDAAAESIHREGARRDRPFVVVDCASIPAALMESELFGHEKGAFTGADRARVGAFEAADGGTLFLDEIGELPLELQPKLLRALESRQIARVGSTRRAAVDVRVIAATHRNLRAEVNAKSFRSDLYFRLAVLEIAVPPLRQRADDLPLLVTELLARLGASDRPGAALLATAKVQAELARHAWPGNVRELRNYVERCLAFDAPPPLEGDAPAAGGLDDVDATRPLRDERERWLRRFERTYLERLLAAHDDNVSAAARAAGIDRIHLYRLLWRCGLREPAAK